MKNEKELEMKKSYTAPKMNVVELKHETNLLQDSCPGGYNCGQLD